MTKSAAVASFQKKNQETSSIYQLYFGFKINPQKTYVMRIVTITSKIVYQRAYFELPMIYYMYISKIQEKIILHIAFKVSC